MDLHAKVFLGQIVQTHFRTEKQMFQEKGLNSCKDTARSSLVLVNAVLDVFIEKETLFPGVMEMAFPVLKEELVDALTLISTYYRFIGAHLYLLSHGWVHVHIALLVQVGS